MLTTKVFGRRKHELCVAICFVYSLETVVMLLIFLVVWSVVLLEHWNYMLHEIKLGFISKICTSRIFDSNVGEMQTRTIGKANVRIENLCVVLWRHGYDTTI
jgi:hypothetical protein